MKKKVGMVSLGCAKNWVDSEQILGMLKDSDYEIVNRPEEADAIIVNTCGFIESAKEESIQTILEMAQFEKKLIVTGCLVERYLDDLKRELPEVDLFVPIRDYPRFPTLWNDLWQEDGILCDFSYRHRLLGTPSFTAYLKISEGCNNCCTYCAIPLIRGPFHSRPYDEILSEAAHLAAQGVKELVVISQDTTRYGSDLTPKKTICDLLRDLLKLPSIAYIRLLYLYPDEVADDLLELIRDEPRLTPYFDLPIQHASSSVLKAMHRRGDEAFLRDLIQNRIRRIVPNAILRTTIIVGFPGETEEDFTTLLRFVEEMQFDHLGAFLYSREEGTASYDYPSQVPMQIKKDRYQRLMKLQKKISYQKNKKRIGSMMTGLVVQVDQKHHRYLLRSGFNAPDGIDGNIYFTASCPLSLGDEVKVKITQCFGYDLMGEYIE